MLLLKSFYLRVTGSSVDFKNRFTSYNIELAVKQNAVNEIMAMVLKQMVNFITIFCKICVQRTSKNVFYSNFLKLDLFCTQYGWSLIKHHSPCILRGQVRIATCNWEFPPWLLQAFLDAFLKAGVVFIFKMCNHLVWT